VYHVLVVDNDPNELDLLYQHLRAPTRDIQKAGSVEAAEALLQSADADWDLLVVDVRLKDHGRKDDLSGLEIAATAKGLGEHAPEVIVITTFPDTNVPTPEGDVPLGLYAMSQGAFAFVPRGCPGIHHPSVLRMNANLALSVKGNR